MGRTTTRGNMVTPGHAGRGTCTRGGSHGEGHIAVKIGYGGAACRERVQTSVVTGAVKNKALYSGQKTALNGK